MKTASFAPSITLVGAALALAAGCAGAPDGSDAISSETQALGRTTSGTSPGRVIGTPRWRGSASSGGTASAPSTPPSPPSNTTGSEDVQAVIAAARTPDGQAIPQPAGPNGECPEVVMLLGFWACPTEGATCSFASGGVTHDCTCNRVDGEGQTPAWVCQ